MTLTAKRSLWMALGVIIVVGAIAGWKVITIRAIIARMATQKQPATVVSSMKAAEQVWQRRLHAVGSFTAVQGVTVTNELDGTVVKIDFESGARVTQGDLLVQLDISSEQAQLANAAASADLAALNLKRAQDLRTKDTNSQSDLDASEAQARQTAANVTVIQATIAKKTIRAPFSGRLGIREVNLGQFLKGGTAVVSLQALDPIFVNFSMPQQDVIDLKVGQAVQVMIDAYPGTVFNGTVNAINSKVDDANRNVQVQATLANADERIKPGMFASVDVVLPEEDHFITLPQTAITYNPYGNSVYVVEDKGRDASGQPLRAVRQQFVELGAQRGDQVAVLKGVKPGDELVTAGQLKLRNGSPVEIDNSVPIGNNPAPKLQNN